MKSGNASNIAGNNTASYDSDTNTLTLNNYIYDGVGYKQLINSEPTADGIYYSGTDDLTIFLKGQNTIKRSTEDSILAGYGIRVEGSAGLVITGEGSLTVSSTNANHPTGLKVNSLTIDEGTSVSVTAGNTNSGKSKGIYAEGTIEVNGVLEAMAGDALGNDQSPASYGIDNAVSDKRILIGTKGKLTAKGGKGYLDSYGIRTQGPIEVNGTLNAEGGESVATDKGYEHGNSYGVLCKDSFLSNGKVTAKGGKGSVGSFGINVTGDNGTLTVNSGTLTVEGGASDNSVGIMAMKTILIDGVVNASEKSSGSLGVGLYAVKSIDIGEKTVLISTGKTNAIMMASGGTISSQINGKGWDNTQGTGNGSLITANNNLVVSEYKKVQFPETKPVATVVTAPTEKSELIYTGSAQELITPGEKGEGAKELQYALGTDSSTTPTEGWDTSIPKATDAGTYYVWYKVLGDANHNDSEAACLTVNISKAKAAAAAVAAKNRTYDGTEKPLVTVSGEAAGGTMNYAVTTEDTAPTDESLYKTSVPEATNAGTYYVWYKVVGDENHTDTDPKCVTATINEVTTPSSTPAQETASKVEISGKVTDSNGTAIEGATVELKMGKTRIKGPIKTTIGGKFSFKEKLEDGTYNIVVTATISEQDRTMTKMVTVSDNGKTISNADVKFPAGNVNSEVEIKKETPGSAKTVVSDIVVDGITAEAEAYTNEAAGGKKVTVTLQAESKTDLTDTDDSNLDSTRKQIKTEQTAIKQAAKTNDGNQKTLDYLDLSMLKTVTDGTSSDQGKQENIHETKSLITIVFKYDFSGKDKLSLYRYHDGNGLSGVQEIGDSDDSTAERIKIDSEAGTITAYLKYFSTYAIGYTTADSSSPGQTTTSSSSSSGSSNGSTVTRTVKMDDIAEKYGITKAEMALTEEAITGLTTDEDPKGSTYYKLLARVTKRAKNSLTLKWDYLPYADGYMVFGARCNTKNKEYKFELLETIDENDITGTRSFAHKDLKAKTYYKYMVVAYKNVGGKKMTVAASKVVHAPTKTAASTVAKKLKTSVSSVKLKVGGTKKLTTKEVKEDKGKKLKRHRKLMYESENPAIATVTKKGGKIKAISKGSVDIYVYAANGTYKKIRVTVK